MNDDTVSVHERHGRTIKIVAVASIALWFLLSDGYDPRLGPITSFYYSMTVHESKWSCRCPEGQICLAGYESMFTDCTTIRIYTKYLVLLSFVLLVYGHLIQKRLVSNPVPRITALTKSRKHDKAMR